MKSPVQNGDLSKYYQKIYQAQDKILKTLFQKNYSHNFYLTGGTALNRFYYQVRYSDDLDFFSNENQLFREDIRLVMELLEGAGFPFLKEIESRDFVRLILFPEDVKLKIDFVNDRVYRYGKPCYCHGIRLDNLINILTNKICAIISRDEPKDVADLITISLNENFIWDEIVSIAQKKENFEKFFLIERLKNFPPQLFDVCSFIKEETKILYSKILPKLIENLIKGEKNSLPIFWKNFFI